jgi:tetratricopeptide (TPR) repeat protein
MSCLANGGAFFPFKFRALLAACLAISETRPLFAQMNMCGHSIGTENQMPADKLPFPQKMTGIGTVHMQITATPEAQMWFDQGLNLLHDFWDYESARAFEQSIRVDPGCAMCYWGLYKAESFGHGTQQGYADETLAKAVSLRRRASKRERLYIEATAADNHALKHSNPEATSSEALQLWRKLVQHYPKDTQARIFMGQSLHDPKQYLATLQSILKDHPDDSAANHYYIHALEASEHPEQALHSAEILASLAPSSGHMVHMPGHIFFRLGDYARAELAFAVSMQVDERYMREQNVDADYDWNYVHNLMYAVTNLMEEGKLQEATTLSLKITAARGKLEPTFYIYSARDSITRLDPRLPVALRTADWAQVLDLLRVRRSHPNQPNLDMLQRQLAGFAGGMQAVEAHKLAQAEDFSARFDAELWRFSEQLKHSPAKPGKAGSKPPAGAPTLQIMPDALLPPLVSTLSVMSLELRGSLMMARRETAEAKELFGQAMQEEKALGYREPPAYIRPVAEAEAASLMLVSDWAGAKVAYEQALLERPRSGFPLYGIALTSEDTGDSGAAAKQYAIFLAAWKDGDSGLPQITHARKYLAEHPPIPPIPERAAQWKEPESGICRSLCRHKAYPGTASLRFWRASGVPSLTIAFITSHQSGFRRRSMLAFLPVKNPFLSLG